MTSKEIMLNNFKKQANIWEPKITRKNIIQQDNVTREFNASSKILKKRTKHVKLAKKHVCDQVHNIETSQYF